MSREIAESGSIVSLQGGKSLSRTFGLRDLPNVQSVIVVLEKTILDALDRLANQRSQMPEHLKLESIRDVLLTYLSNSPAKLGQHGVSWDNPEAIGELLLNLGKCLKWMSPHVDAYGRENTNAGPPRGQQARSVLELGEQFRLLGLQYLNASDRAKEFSAQEVRRRLIAIEAKMSGGGAPNASRIAA